MARKRKSTEIEMQAVTADDLKQLLAKSAICGSEMAEVRGAYGQEVKRLEETKGLNTKVFNLVKSLLRGKNSTAVFAAKRDFDAYCDLLGLNDQSDIEQFIKAQPDLRSPMEKAMDGEVDAEPLADAPAAPEEARVAKKSDMARFRAALRDADDENAVEAGVVRFCADFPGSAGEARKAADERLFELGEQPSEGEAPEAPKQKPGPRLRAV